MQDALKFCHQQCSPLTKKLILNYDANLICVGKQEQMLAVQQESGLSVDRVQMRVRLLSKVPSL